MTLYVEVTQDEYSLPVRVCGTVVELAKMTGLSANNVSSQISKGIQGKYKYPRFIKVNVE